jgi:hypothetical protein
MANVTFNNLPDRGTLGSNDFFVINSSDRLTLPEGKVNFNILRSKIREGLLTGNYFFEGQKSVIVKTSSTTDNTITINDENRLILFDNPNNVVYGSFQLECLRTGTVTLNNALCQYSLQWIPVNTQPGIPRLPITLIDNVYIPINNSTQTITNSNFQNLQLNSFTPLGSGNFRLTVKFTLDAPTAKALVNYKLTLLQQQ